MMKLSSVLALTCLIFSSQGDFLDTLSSTFLGIGDAFASAAKQAGEQAQTVGKQLLDQVTTQGTQLVSQTLQSLLMGSMNALTQTPSKRDVQQVVGLYSSLKNEAQQAVVERIGNLQGMLKEAISQMEQSFGKLTNVPVAQIEAEIKHIVATHKGLSDLLVKDLTNNLVKIYSKALPAHTKRNLLTDALSSVAKTTASFFQPHVDAINNLVNGVGNSLTNTAQTFTNALQNSEHTSAIASSSQAILEHGKNAIAALQQSVTDILQQTVSNMQPHLVNIIQHSAAALTDGVNSLNNNANPETNP